VAAAGPVPDPLPLSETPPGPPAQDFGVDT